MSPPEPPQQPQGTPPVTDEWGMTPREYVLVGAVAVLWSIYSYNTDPFDNPGWFYAVIFLPMVAFGFWLAYLVVVKGILPWVLKSMFGEQQSFEMLNLVVGAATAAALGAVMAKVFG
jgi:hypothetical protein